MTVQLDEFKNRTPYGELQFTNIVGRLNPDADKFLTLACHYDSKYFADFEFVAATDSAVPCAIMLSVVRTLLPALTDANRRNKAISLQLLFLDGEEAFVDWTPEDSLYGSRHLAQKWQNTKVVNSKGRQVTELQRIVRDSLVSKGLPIYLYLSFQDLFVLLDLIGAQGSQFYSLFQNTNSQHRQLYGIERSLGRIGRLQSRNFQFQRRELPNAQIDDDHVPFLKRGVPILHLISVPFPNDWHKEGDNYRSLDFSSIRSFNDVLRVYVYNYLTHQRS